MDGDTSNQPESPSPWKFTSSAAPSPDVPQVQEEPDEQQPAPGDEAVQWTASEFVAHRKTCVG